MASIRWIFSFFIVSFLSFCCADSVKVTLLTCFDDLSSEKARQDYHTVLNEEKGKGFPLLSALMSTSAYAEKLPFDFALSSKEANSEFFLGSNVLYLEQKDSYLKPILRDVKGIVLGIFGLCNPFPRSTDALYFLPPIETARKMTRVCKERGADLVLLYCDLPLPEIKKIAREVQGIDLIIGKNSNGQIAWFEEKTFIYLGGARLAKIDLILEMKHSWRGKHLSFYPTWQEVFPKK